jgi:colicin import membrane protein
MNARYSQGYVASFLLHGGVIAGILLLAFLADQAGLDKPKILEMVAGEGDNYAATEAPAIGVPGGIKAVLPPAPSAIPPVEVPPTPPAPDPTPPAPETVPIEPVPTPEAVPAPKPKPTPTKAKIVPKKDPTTANFTKTFNHTAHHKAARLEAKYRKQQAEQERREKMSYDQYLKTHGGVAGSHSTADPEGIRGGVVGGSTANPPGGAGGKAMSREEASLLDAYFSLLKARVHENFEAPSDVNDKLVVRISFFVSADGSISRVHVVHSSGSAAFDEAVLAAFRRTHSIGPRPDHHGDEVGLAFSLREEDAG